MNTAIAKEDGSCNRREFLKTAATAVTIAGVSTQFVTRSVVATDSGEPELTVSATIPSNTSISITLTEAQNPDGSEQVATATLDLEDGVNTYQLSELEGDDTNYAKPSGSFSGDGESTPELDFDTIVLDVPTIIEPDEFSTTNYTEQIDWVAKRADTEILDGEYLLRKYQPLLVMNSEVRDRIGGLEGYVCRHPDEDLTVLCYWLRASHQQSPPLVASHTSLGDHRPIYVFVDESNSSIEKVVYSGWFWRAGEKSADELTTATIRGNDPTHPVLEVFGPWHHLRAGSSVTGTFLDLQVWPENRSSWMSHGVYDLAAPATIEDPWIMHSGRPSWWRRPSLDSSLADFWAQMGQLLNKYGIRDADGLR